MADNVEETKPVDAQENAEEGELNSEQSFAYWLTMLPFIGIAGVFLFEFSKTPGEYNKLINAAGAVVLGILVASCVSAFTKNNENKNADSSSSPSDAPKAEGSN